MEELKIDDIKRAIKALKSNMPNPPRYLYIMPSPRKGKQLVIVGPIGPGEAADMAYKVWTNRARVEDFEYMKEEEVKNGLEIDLIEMTEKY